MNEAAFDINDTFAFHKVLFFGRTLCEYLGMFNVEIAKLKGQRVLDCPAGPASFVAECRQQGIQAVGCDPMYGEDKSTLSALIEREREECLARQARVRHLFDEEKPVDDYRSAKLAAFERFIEDYDTGLKEGRYMRAGLPELPFSDAAFDLALSSNFLFLYSDYQEGGMLIDSPFNYEFHLKAVLELLRVAKDVRIYPLKGPHKDAHSFVWRIVEHLSSCGFCAEVVAVPYRDVKGAHHMLRITYSDTGP